MEIRLDGRAVLVAGCGGGGIGTAITVMLARAGATVVGVDKTELGRQTARDALDAAGQAGRHLILEADLTDEGSVGALVETATREAGPLRGLVNVVGGMLPGHWQALTDPLQLKAFHESLAFNLDPPLIAGAAAARAMRAHGQGGSIVNITSASGVVSMPFGAGYGAAKAGLINLTRTMAAEWGRFGIRVNAIAPGTIRTAKLGRASFDNKAAQDDEKVRGTIPLGRRGVPDDIAGPVLFLISDLAAYVSGQIISVDGGVLSRPPFVDGDNLPVFVTDPALRGRLTGS
jgi:NAD(P)-dependent dehydrogenase (short-subunit alcohol dehydrogenase family)